MRRWLVAVLGLVAVVVAGCGYLAYLVVRTPYVEDEAALAVRRHMLQPAIVDLNAVPSPRYARPTGPAHVTGCSMDSGQLFQPWAGREWRLYGPARIRSSRIFGSGPAGRQALTRLAESLRDRGWTGSTEPDKVGAIELSRDPEGRSLGITLQVFEDGILANVGAPGLPRVCRMR